MLANESTMQRQSSAGTSASRTRIALLSPAVGTGNVGDHFIEMAIRRMLHQDVVFQPFSIRRPLRADEIEAINATSCALLCGTNLYQANWESALTPDLISRITVPIVPFGVGSSAAGLTETGVGEQTRRMVKMLHERCAAGSVRDPHSAEIVERIGVPNYMLTGCPVLFWAQAPALPRVRALSRRRVVFTARNWLMHRWPDNVNHPVQIDLLRRLIAHFAGYELLFAVHEGFDRELLKILKLPTEQVVDSADPVEYVRLYSDPANVIFAMRLHAGMLALANGVPAVLVGHDTRTYSFCEMMNLDCIRLFDEGCLARCISAIELALAGEVESFAGMNERFPALDKQMRTFMERNALPARERAGTAA